MVQNREVVAERLAAGSGGNDDDVLSRFGALAGFGLMGIKAGDSTSSEDGAEFRTNGVGKVGVFRGTSGCAPDRSDGAFVGSRERLQLLNKRNKAVFAIVRRGCQLSEHIRRFFAPV